MYWVMQDLYHQSEAPGGHPCGPDVQRQLPGASLFANALVQGISRAPGMNPYALFDGDLKYGPLFGRWSVMALSFALK